LRAMATSREELRDKASVQKTLQRAPSPPPVESVASAHDLPVANVVPNPSQTMGQSQHKERGEYPPPQTWVNPYAHQHVAYGTSAPPGMDGFVHYEHFSTYPRHHVGGPYYSYTPQYSQSYGHPAPVPMYGSPNGWMEHSCDPSMVYYADSTLEDVTDQECRPVEEQSTPTISNQTLSTPFKYSPADAMSPYWAHLGRAATLGLQTPAKCSPATTPRRGTDKRDDLDWSDSTDSSHDVERNFAGKAQPLLLRHNPYYGYPQVRARMLRLTLSRDCLFSLPFVV
jgi:hypothetical protein